MFHCVECCLTSSQMFHCAVQGVALSCVRCCGRHCARCCIVLGVVFGVHIVLSIQCCILLC